MKAKREIKFSVVIPLFNKEDTIQRCIQSVLNQSYNNYEIVIINDGSTDNSVNQINKQFDTYNLKIFSQQNSGVSCARNKGIEMSTGNWIAFLDADDYWERSYLASIFSIITETCDSYGIIQHNYFKSNKINKEIAHSRLKTGPFPNINWMLPTFTSAICIRKDLLDSNKFREDLNYGEDTELWLRVLNESKGFYCSRALVTYETTSHYNNLLSVKDKLIDRDYVFHILKIKLSNLEGYSEFQRNYFLKNMRIYFLNDNYRDLINERMDSIKPETLKEFIFKLYYEMPRFIIKWLYPKILKVKYK